MTELLAMSIAERARAVRKIMAETHADEHNNTSLLSAYHDLYMRSSATHTSLRLLTDEEFRVVQTAIFNATQSSNILMPFFNIMQFVYAPSMETLGVDDGGRVAVGSWFFDSAVASQERSTLVSHEAMHLLLNHTVGGAYPSRRVINVAEDLIINTQLMKSHMEFPHIHSPRREGEKIIGLLPEYMTHVAGYPHGLPQDWNFDQYYAVLSDTDSNGDTDGDSHSSSSSSSSGDNGDSSDSTNNEAQDSSAQGDNNSSDSQGSSGNSSNNSSHGEGSSFSQHQGCDSITPAQGKALDDLGVHRASEVRKNNARARALDIAASMRNTHGISSTGTGLEDFVVDVLGISRVCWRSILNRVVARRVSTAVCGGEDKTWKNVRRACGSVRTLHMGDEDYRVSAMIGIDTSASMSIHDYRKALSEVSAILSSRKVTDVRYTTVDTQITSMSCVHRLADVNLRGGGGTRMEVFFDYVATMKGDTRPDIAILTTDGFIDVEATVQSARKTKVQCIILVTDETAYNTYFKGMSTPRNVTIIPLYDVISSGAREGGNS